MSPSTPTRILKVHQAPPISITAPEGGIKQEEQGKKVRKVRHLQTTTRRKSLKWFLWDVLDLLLYFEVQKKSQVNKEPSGEKRRNFLGKRKPRVDMR